MPRLETLISSILNNDAERCQSPWHFQNLSTLTLFSAFVFIPCVFCLSLSPGLFLPPSLPSWRGITIVWSAWDERRRRRLTFLPGIRENVLCFACFFMLTPWRVRKPERKEGGRRGGKVNEMGLAERATGCYVKHRWRIIGKNRGKICSVV